MTTEPNASETLPGDGAAAPAKREKKEDSFPVFLIKLLLIVLVFRSFILSPFNIPSESMLPRLQKGDYLLASKWSYGYSKYSLPFSAPLIPGRLFASQPERGDVAIFKAPPGNDVDYIKRVIGLPGDQIQMIGGVLHINGKAVAKERIADAQYPVSPYNQCHEMFRSKREDGTDTCRYPQYRETLPNGVSYNVLDLGLYAADDTQVFVVPEGHLFMMGDNRDNSEDSRFDPEAGGGVGFVPQENLVGKAQVMMFSTDGSSSWLLPWTWFTAARWDRIGGRI
ncbi:signal peptidase I [Novosphingobium sp. TH158]|uniref:signal peptidase I n=1 Tax=Novosphingobium sp. TH158 TaxID=2067455 RepID=UPI000C7A9B31|nr:signal peptidase I [Novosphingobium sp. TH158]PLK26122.1 signal peptidase I [Novosphingobium sp. TH158]